jgi:glycosyltransferase involved in cell wall biosynthesis
MAHIVLAGNTAWGMFNFRQNLMKLLIHQGHIVTIIAPPNEKFERKIIETGCAFIPIEIESKGTNPISDLLLIRKYFKIYKSLSPDFIFHYTIKPNIYGTLASWLARIPSIAVVTGLGYTFINKGLVSHIALYLYRVSFKVSKQVWFLNNEDCEIFTRNNVVSKEKTFVLKGEGINVNHFSRSFSESSQITFLLASRMLWDKGVGEYFDAAKILKKNYHNVKFNLLGPHGIDNPKAIPEDQIHQWHSEGILNYLGETDDIKPFINSATAVVLPSYREGISRVLLEAAAMEKPVITTDVVGCRDVVIDNITGFICEPRNSQSLAEAMLKIICLEKKDIETMGKKGREFVQNEFSDEVVLKKYSETLEFFTKGVA